MIKEIQLTKGQVALVDDEDYDRLMQWKWFANYDKTINNYYALRRGSIGMHRDIMGLQKGDNIQVDHINRNTLDNRKANLRLVTQKENNRNQDIRKDNSSGYKGVGYYKRYGKWRARIGINNTSVLLGYFDTPEEAYEAYKIAALNLHGEYSNIKGI